MSRFSPSGDPLPFPGNTILVHVPADYDLKLKPILLSSILKSSSPSESHRAVVLPFHSWHMTIVGGVCDLLRSPDRWPPGKASMPLQHCHVLFARLLTAGTVNLVSEGLGPPYKVHVRGVERFGDAIGMVLGGATSEEEQRLRKLKDRLADVLGFRHPNHHDYSWHISMAYLQGPWTDAEVDALLSKLRASLGSSEEVLEFGPPEFCTFEDMTLYHRRLFICSEDSD